MLVIVIFCFRHSKNINSLFVKVLDLLVSQTCPNPVYLCSIQINTTIQYTPNVCLKHKLPGFSEGSLSPGPGSFDYTGGQLGRPNIAPTIVPRNRTAKWRTAVVLVRNNVMVVFACQNSVFGTIICFHHLCESIKPLCKMYWIHY